MLNIFSCAYWPSVFLRKMSIQGFCPFFNWTFLCMLLSCMCSLYILDINPMSNIWFADIFFHSVGCIFILLMVSFAAQKLLVWCSPVCLFFQLFKFNFLIQSYWYSLDHDLINLRTAKEDNKWGNPDVSCITTISEMNQRVPKYAAFFT